MTERVEIRAPLRSVRIAVACKCGVEMVVEPGSEKQVVSVGPTRVCAICGADLDSGLIKALWHISQALHEAGGRADALSVVVRRSNA